MLLPLPQNMSERWHIFGQTTTRHAGASPAADVRADSKRAPHLQSVGDWYPRYRIHFSAMLSLVVVVVVVLHRRRSAALHISCKIQDFWSLLQTKTRENLHLTHQLWAIYWGVKLSS